MIARIEAALFGLNINEEVAPVTLLVGQNQSGKSTRLGLADLVIRGGSAGVYPVLGRPKGPWSASVVLNGRRYTRAGKDGLANGCRIDGVKVAVRDFDAEIQAKAGAAGVWRLREFSEATPSARLDWIVGTLFEGADTSGLASAVEEALTGLGDLRAALQIGAAPWTPEAVQQLRRALADELTRRGLTPDLAPRGPRFKEAPLPDTPSERAVGHALVDTLATVLKLAAQLRRADAKSAEAEAERLAQRIAARGELPAGTVASNRAAAEALQTEINQLLERRQQDYADLRRRESAEQAVVDATTGLQQALAAAPRSAADVRAALLLAQAEHSAALTALETARHRAEELEREVKQASDRATATADTEAAALVAEAGRAEVERVGAEVAELLGAVEAALLDLRSLIEAGRLRAAVLERPSMAALLDAAASVRARVAEPAPPVVAAVEDKAATEAAQAKAALLEARARSSAQAREVMQLTGAEAGKRATMDALGRELQELDASAVAQRANVEACQQRLRLAQEALNRVPVVAGLELSDAVIDSKTADRAALIAAADRLSDVAGDQVALESARADAQRLQAELDVVIKVRDAITAAKAWWLTTQLDGALEPARRITQAVLGLDVDIKTSDEGAHIVLGDVDLDTVQGDQLRSPQIVALAALRVAMLARLDGLRALFVDDLESIDEGRRAKFLAALAAEVRAGTIHQVMGASVDALPALDGDDVRVVTLFRS
jgi:hypothetical protein